ncbi:MAG: hypothetical protein HOP08_14630 [Cyclobacteriaceae bacterium]|nr:hypothetical protein [Cyclobacteriaceae bacterium]
MQNRKDEIEKILNSLDGIRRSEANHFLFEKIRNRMESAKAATPSPMITKWAIGMSFLILINALAWMQIRENKSPRENPMNTIAAEYGFTNSTYHY